MNNVNFPKSLFDFDFTEENNFAAVDAAIADYNEYRAKVCRHWERNNPEEGITGLPFGSVEELTERKSLLENLRTSALVADRMGAYFRICEEIDRYNDAIEAVSTPFAAELVVTMNREEKKAEPKEEPREEITSAPAPEPKPKAKRVVKRAAKKSEPKAEPKKEENTEVKTSLPEIKLSYSNRVIDNVNIKCARDVYGLFVKTFEPGEIEFREHLKVLYLNRRNQPIGFYTVSMGSAVATVFDLHAIMAGAILSRAEGVVMCHNHPSGGLKSSPQDDDITRDLRDACKFMKIKMLDHIIITKDDYYSYMDNGRL